MSEIRPLDVVTEAAQRGLNVRVGHARMALEGIPEMTINTWEAEIDAEFSHTFWDGVSSINGIDASVWLRRDDVQTALANDGKIVTISRNGKLILFQPDYPGMGPMDDEKANQFIREWIGSIVDQEVRRKVITEALERALEIAE